MPSATRLRYNRRKSAGDDKVSAITVSFSELLSRDKKNLSSSSLDSLAKALHQQKLGVRKANRYLFQASQQSQLKGILLTGRSPERKKKVHWEDDMEFLLVQSIENEAGDVKCDEKNERKIIPTKFLLISDTHDVYPSDTDSQSPFRNPLPGCDVLIHAGDMTDNGREAEYQKFLDWICKINAEVKIIIAGTKNPLSLLCS